VIATIGPASDSPATIEAMIRAGMNVARLNFSHGSHAEHRKRLECIRETAARLDANVAIMLDTKGVEIRTGRVEGGVAHLTTGESFDLYLDDRVGNARGVAITLSAVPEALEVDSPILLDDGVIELRVQEVRADRIGCNIRRGGRLEDRKGVNLPDTAFERHSMSPQDREDLRFACDHQIEYIAASFVRTGADVLEIRNVLEEFGTQIPIIAKIENREGVKNLEEIISAASGTMVARGDLGVELALREVPMVQKRIIRTTVMNGKPVVTATQMLDSMERNPVPTRAEVSDVANAILDGTSAVMLSGETAVGSYPVEAVRTMAALALEAESSLGEFGTLQHILPEPAHAVTEAVCQAAITMANHLEAAIIVTLTETGFTSRSISKFRPDCPILAITVSPDVVRKLAMNWGVTAMLFEGERSDQAMIEFALRRARDLGYVQHGDVVVVTAGTGGETGSTDTIRVVTV
jgi:pyruvate kinase